MSLSSSNVVTTFGASGLSCGGIGRPFIFDPNLQLLEY